MKMAEPLTPAEGVAAAGDGAYPAPENLQGAADALAEQGPRPRAPWRGELNALLALGVPMGLTQIIQFSVNTVDILMIGRLGPEPLAAASIGIVIFYAAWLFGLGPALAVGPLAAQALGADPDATEDVRHSIRMSFWALAIGFAPLLLIFIFAPQIVLALGQPQALASLAGPYVLALAPGLPFALAVIVLRTFLAAIGEARAPLVIMVLTTLLNAGLNGLLIYGAFGFPRLELVGAGIASSLSHAVGFALLVFYIRRNPKSARFHVFRDFLTPHWARLKEIAALGWPIGVTIAFEAMLFNACVFLMGRIGVAEVAAYQVAVNVAALAFMMPLGLSMAGGVRVGLAAGAGDLAGVRRAAALTVLVSVAAILCIALPAAIAPSLIANLYLRPDDPANAEVLALAASFLRMAAAFMVFDGVQVAANQTLRGLKDVRFPMIATGVAYWVVGFPLAAWLGLGSPVGAIGVWWGLLASLAVASILLGARLIALTGPRAAAIQPG